MLAVLVHKDNLDVCSDPTLVSPGDTRVTARKDKEALSKEHVLLKSSCPVETHGDVEHQIKRHKSRGCVRM